MLQKAKNSLSVVESLDQSESERKSWYRNHREKSIYRSFDDVSVRTRKKTSGCPTFLKRSHSFAVSKENLLNGVIPSVLRNSKSKKREAKDQFIPRAKLVEKSLCREQRRSLQNYYPNLKNLSSLSIDRKNHSETCLNNIAYTSLSNLRWQSSEYMSPYARNITRNFGYSNNFTSLNNLSSGNWNFSEFETSISYDENITLARKKIEDQQLKPKTIRAPTPYYQSNLRKTPLDTQEKVSQENISNSENLDANLTKTNSINIQELEKDWDISPADNIGGTPLDKTIENETENIYAEYQESDNPSSIDFETNTNFDEIDLENDNIRKFSENLKLHYKTYKVSKSKENNKFVEVAKDEINKNKDITRIKVESDPTDQSTENHITKIEVDLDTKEIRRDLPKPNFKLDKHLPKTNSNHCLCEKFNSLPDISVKSLQNHEKAEKSINMAKALENKFVVNIGRHFDLSEKSRQNGDCQMLQKSENSKIYSGQNGAKIINWADTTNIRKIENQSPVKQNVKSSFKTKNKNEENAMKKNPCNAEDEIRRKLENMRQYWNNIGKTDKNSQESSCKVIELQKKQVTTTEKVANSVNSNHSNENVSRSSTHQDNINNINLQIMTITKDRLNISSNPLNRNTPYNSMNLDNTKNTNQQNLASKKNIGSNQFKHANENMTNNLLHQNNKTNTNYQNMINIEHTKNNDKDRATDSKTTIQNTKEKLQKSKTIAEFSISNNSKNEYHPSNQRVDFNHNNILNKCQSLVFDEIASLKTEEVLEAKRALPNIKKQLFYNSLKIHRGFNQEELPNPETVKLTRQFFEKRLRQDDKIKSQSIRSVSGSLCDLSDMEGREQVSEAILEKIREHGSTVTYYGGKIVDQHLGEPVLTKVIMKEIEGIQKICK